MCLLLTGWHQIRIFTTGKPFWLKLLTFKPPRFGFLLFTQFRQCFAKTPSISCDIVLYLNIQARVPSRHWSLLGCTYPHPLISWATSALYLVDRPDPWVFWFGNHLSAFSLLLVMLGIQCTYCIFTLRSLDNFRYKALIQVESLLLEILKRNGNHCLFLFRILKWFNLYPLMLNFLNNLLILKIWLYLWLNKVTTKLHWYLMYSNEVFACIDRLSVCTIVSFVYQKFALFFNKNFEIMRF